MTAPSPRWLMFSGVGLMGALVQLGAVHAFTGWGGANPLHATGAAIELALVHNFLWHERFTWRDRPCADLRCRLRRFAAFHLANGVMSLAGNLAITAALLSASHLPVIAANGVAICVCATANFLMGGRWVFRCAMGKRRRPPGP